MSEQAIIESAQDTFETPASHTLFLVRVTTWEEDYGDMGGLLDHDAFEGYSSTGDSLRIVDGDELGELSVSCGESEGRETYKVLFEFDRGDLAEITETFKAALDQQGC